MGAWATPTNDIMKIRRITFSVIRRSLLIQRPPIVEDSAVAVSLLREAWISPHFFAAHSLEPALALAVLGVLDVLACVQEGPALKVTVHIAPVGRVAGKLDNGQPLICLFLAFLAAIPPPSSA